MPDDERTDTRFSCRFLNKVRSSSYVFVQALAKSIQALASVFKSKLLDSKGGDGAIERCEASIVDNPDEFECRLMVKMLCKLGTLFGHIYSD